jgi:hypothetical protein
VLTAEEARALLEAIAPLSSVALRDRALIALMVYTFARVGAALKMRLEDVYVQGHCTWVRLHEKGGKQHEMPCHHNLEAYLHAYLDGAGLGGDGKGWLFRTALGRTGRLSERPLSRADAWRMIRRRAAGAGIHTPTGNHSFRATGITEYPARPWADPWGPAAREWPILSLFLTRYRPRTNLRVYLCATAEAHGIDQRNARQRWCHRGGGPTRGQDRRFSAQRDDPPQIDTK